MLAHGGSIPTGSHLLRTGAHWEATAQPFCPISQHGFQLLTKKGHQERSQTSRRLWRGRSTETQLYRVQESRARKQCPGEKLKAAVVLCTGCSSGGWLGKDRVSQRDIQGVIVLHQGRVLVVQDQVLEGGVEVVGLREAVARRRLVDDAVLGVAVHPAGERRESGLAASEEPPQGERRRGTSRSSPKPRLALARGAEADGRPGGSPACQLTPPPASSIWQEKGRATRERGRSQPHPATSPSVLPTCLPESRWQPRAHGGTHTTEQA